MSVFSANVRIRLRPEVEDEVHKFGGTWSESKLDCVEKYARAYLQVMQSQHWCKLEYVDAFAGRGRQALPPDSRARHNDLFFGDESERMDTEEFLIGSALRALAASSEATRPFDRFLFIDTGRDSCSELKSIVASEYHALKQSVKVVCDDANTVLGDYVDQTDWKSTRSLVFLDPYGLEVEWGLVHRLAATQACDVWYLFPLGGVMRMMKNNGQIPEAWETRLDRLFGTHDWHGEFYKPSPQQSLFPFDKKTLMKDASTNQVVDYIRAQLDTVFPAVSDAAVLRNSKGAPLFALVLGVSNPSRKAQTAALKIANHLVKGLNQL